MRQLLLLLPLLLAFGCRPAVPEDGPVTRIRFWNGFSGPDGETMRQIVARFNREHKDVQVDMEIIPWGTFYDKVTLGLAFGGAPDLFVLHVNRFPEYASHGVLADATNLYPTLPQSKFVPAAYGAAEWQGRRYGLPLDIHPLVMYYNLDLFEKAGVKEPPRTYAEFLDAARKLTKGEGLNKQWGFAFTNLHSNAYLFWGQHGGQLLTPDLKRSAVDSPEVRRAFAQMREIYEKYKVAPRPEGQDAWFGFKTGKVAMVMEGIYMMADLQKQKGLRFAIAPVPQFGPKPSVWAGSHILVIPKDVPEKRQVAAAKFAAYLSDHSLDWSEGGQLPARADLIASDRFRQMRLQYPAAEQLDRLHYEPASVYFNLIATYGDSAIEKVVNRIEPDNAALATAERRINTVLARQ